MYLVVFTRKRLKPLIRKIPLLILLALPAVPLVFTVAALYFHFAAAALEKQAAGLQLEIAEAYAQLAAADSLARLAKLSSPATENASADILIDLRPPAGGDTLPSAPIISGENGGGVYAVQVSSHHSREEAERVISELAPRLPRPLLIQRTQLANGTWFRVLIEPFASRDEADSYADSLSRAGTVREYILHRLPADWRSGQMMESNVTN